MAFHKHRAEGETNNTFAYVDAGTMRVDAFRAARELLWALDVAWTPTSPARRCVVNFLRQFGGPIHIMMRRYRFVEDGLVVGKAETEEVVSQTRRHFKLWNRVDANRRFEFEDGRARYEDAIAREGGLMFPGLAELLEGSDRQCGSCRYRLSYGAEVTGRFGGVELCEACREVWCEYVRSLPLRASRVFPVLAGLLKRQ